LYPMLQTVLKTEPIKVEHFDDCFAWRNNSQDVISLKCTLNSKEV
jgi:hypothetical protein